METVDTVPLDFDSLNKLHISNLNNHIPTEFFDIENYDRIGLLIYNHLNSAFSECNIVLEGHQTKTLNNLVAVFYPSLVRMLSTWYFNKYELDIIKFNYGLNFLFSKNKQSLISFFSNYQIVNDSDYRYKIINDQNNLLKKIFKSYLKQILYNKKILLKNRTHIKSISFANNLSISYKEIIDKIKFNNFEVNYKFPVFAQQKVYIDCFDKQWDILKECVKNIERDLQKFWPANLNQTNEITNYIKRVIKNYISKNDFQIHSDLVITGSLIKQSSRFLASTAKKYDVKVISIWHGESIGTLDEPFFGLSEQTFCDEILGFGDYGCNCLQNGNFSKGFFQEPIVTPASSDLIRRINKQDNIEKITNLNNKTMMYIPTAFNDNNRYGPFRDIHDLAYFSWQKEMLKAISKIFHPKEIIRKSHNKDVIKTEFKVDGVKNITGKADFSELLDLADIFIFDTPTTAFTIAAATCKPILYFDIGFRNFKRDALEAIKERCIYTRGSPINAEDLVNSVFKSKEKKSFNSYTKQYSLGDSTKKRVDVLIDSIKSIL